MSPVGAFIRSAVAACVALALSFGSVPYARAADQPEKMIPINVGLPISNYWPAYVAREKKLFEQVGLEPHFYSFTTGAPLIAGMKSGSLDVAWTGLATLFMLGQGIPLTFILVPLDSSSQMALVVNSSSGIKSYRDIGKSKNIGGPTATCAEVSTVLAAKAAGVPYSSLHVTNLAPELLQTALDRGQIDSTFIWGPWNLRFRDAGYKIVSWDKEFQINGGVCATTVAVRPAFLAANPSVGCKLVKVHALSLMDAKKDPELAIKTMQDAFNIPHAMAKETYDTLKIPTIKSQVEPNSPWSLTNKSGGLSQKLYVASQALYDSKAFDKPLSQDAIAQSIDPKYITQFLDTNCK